MIKELKRQERRKEIGRIVFNVVCAAAMFFAALNLILGDSAETDPVNIPPVTVVYTVPIETLNALMPSPMPMATGTALPPPRNPEQYSEDK